MSVGCYRKSNKQSLDRDDLVAISNDLGPLNAYTLYTGISQPVHHFIEDKVVAQARVHDAYVAEHRHHARLFILTRDSLADERCHIQARRDHNPT